MKFAKGNKRAPGGKRPGAGRPTKEKQAAKKAIDGIVKAYIEKHIQPVLKAYLHLSGGRWVNHYNQQTGQFLYKEWEVDAGTLRHWIDKAMPSPRSAPLDKDGKAVPEVHYHMPNLEPDD